MKKLGDGIGDLLTLMHSGDESARKARRAAQVKSAWRAAVEKVYQDAAPFVLGHTNGVYVGNDGGVLCLTVYSDDSLVRSDIDARQEFLKMALAESGVRADVFRIIASRFGMKARRPYGDGTKDSERDHVARLFEKAERTPLSPEETAVVDERVSVVEDGRVRNALRSAMIAEMEYHGKNQ